MRTDSIELAGHYKTNLSEEENQFKFDVEKELPISIPCKT